MAAEKFAARGKRARTAPEVNQEVPLYKNKKKGGGGGSGMQQRNDKKKKKSISCISRKEDMPVQKGEESAEK